MNKTYFENKVAKLILGDCCEVLKSFNEKSIDLIFADPPYFLSSGGISCHSGKQVIVNKGEWDKTLLVQDRIEYNRKWIKECKRVLKDDGSIWISGTFHNIYTVGVALELEGFSIINNITRKKPNPTPNLGCRCFTNSTETILWASKKMNVKKKEKYFFNYKLMKEMNNNKQMQDMWVISVPKIAEKKYGKHPTQKPVELLKKILLSSTNENDIVLDPFCGSSTTGIACKELMRKFIGIDNTKEYLDLSIKRLQE